MSKGFYKLICLFTRKGAKTMKARLYYFLMGIDFMSALAIIVEAEAAEFKSDLGFSLTYPDGWFVLTKEQEHSLKPEIKTALHKMGMGNVDFRGLAVMIIGPLDGDKVALLTVTVIPITLDAEKTDRDQLVKSLTAGYRQRGIPPINIVSAVTKYNGNKAISIHYDLPTFMEGMHLWQVLVPGKTQSYLVTSNRDSSERNKYEPIFQNILNSLNIDIKNTR